MSCGYCDQNQDQFLATCMTCHALFCNTNDKPASLSHILKHLKETQHTSFSVPEKGVLKCLQCGKNNIIDLFITFESSVLCSEHKQDSNNKIVQGKKLCYFFPRESQQPCLQTSYSTQGDCLTNNTINSPTTIQQNDDLLTLSQPKPILYQQQSNQQGQNSVNEASTEPQINTNLQVHLNNKNNIIQQNIIHSSKNQHALKYEPKLSQSNQLLNNIQHMQIAKHKPNYQLFHYDFNTTRLLFSLPKHMKYNVKTIQNLLLSTKFKINLQPKSCENSLQNAIKYSENWIKLCQNDEFLIVFTTKFNLIWERQIYQKWSVLAKSVDCAYQLLNYMTLENNFSPKIIVSYHGQKWQKSANLDKFDVKNLINSPQIINQMLKILEMKYQEQIDTQHKLNSPISFKQQILVQSNEQIIQSPEQFLDKQNSCVKPASHNLKQTNLISESNNLVIKTMQINPQHQINSNNGEEPDGQSHTQLTSNLHIDHSPTSLKDEISQSNSKLVNYHSQDDTASHQESNSKIDTQKNQLHVNNLEPITLSTATISNSSNSDTKPANQHHSSPFFLIYIISIMNQFIQFNQILKILFNNQHESLDSSNQSLESEEIGEFIEDVDSQKPINKVENRYKACENGVFSVQINYGMENQIEIQNEKSGSEQIDSGEGICGLNQAEIDNKIQDQSYQIREIISEKKDQKDENMKEGQNALQIEIICKQDTGQGEKCVNFEDDQKQINQFNDADAQGKQQSINKNNYLSQNEDAYNTFQSELEENNEEIIDNFITSILEQIEQFKVLLKGQKITEIIAKHTSIDACLQNFRKHQLQVPPFVQKRVDEIRLQIKEFQQTQITKSTQEDRFQKESDAQQIIHKPISIQPANKIENDSQFQGNQIITLDQLEQVISAQSNYPGIQIKNTYASCYANTAIQTLISISALRSLINSEYYLNVRSPFIQPLREILNTHNTLIEPEQFYDNLSIFSMSKWEQSDAAELFMLLIGHLHEAESEAANLPYTNEATAIQQLFGCVLENRTECMRCGRTKVSNEVTRCQFLPFQKSIKQSLRASCKAVEIQGYNCDDCGKDAVLMKSQCIARAARCVVFQIDRWGSGGEKCCDGIKIKEAIEFQDGVTHQLKAVICHQGDSARCGHFYCYVYTGWGWELRNDEVVQQVGFDQICLNNVYMLIYEQDNNISYSGISQETFSYPREVIARMISSKNITRQEELDYQQQPFNLQQYQQDIGYDNTKQETIDQYLYQQNIITYDDPKESVQIGDGQQQPVYFQQDQYGNSYDMEQERIHQSQENIISYDPPQDNLQFGYYNFYQEENAGNFRSQNQMIPRGEDQYHQQQLVSIEQNSYYIGYDNMEHETIDQSQQNNIFYDDPNENHYIGDDNFQASTIVLGEDQYHQQQIQQNSQYTGYDNMEQQTTNQNQQNIVNYDDPQENYYIGDDNFQASTIVLGEDQYHQQQIQQNFQYTGYDNMEQQTTNQNQQNIVNYDDPQENYYIGDDNFQTSPIVVLEENQTHTNQEITDTSNKQQPSDSQQKFIDKFSSDILMQIDKLNMLNEQQKQDFSENRANQTQQLITIIQKSINLFTQTNLQLPNYAQKRINVFRKQLSQ